MPPQPSPWLIARSRLVSRLDDARHFPVTLVSAAAGSGKTTLLAAWARALDLPWGWLTVDQADTTFDLFLTNLIAAMQVAAPGVGESALAQLRLDEEPHLGAIIAELDDDLLALDGELVVVLDDIHALDDPRSIEFLTLFLQHPPPGLHLVVGARRDPPLPLARLRSRGQLLEIRAADLVFTTDETRSLLQNAGVPGELAEPLEQRNQGWAVGIHLGALALRGQSAGDWGAGGMDEGVRVEVHDLIVDDILALQTEPLQQLLLVSSLVEQFTGDLCAALLDHPNQLPEMRALLQELAAEGLLLFSQGGDPEWFRYHQVFREVLRRELALRVRGEELAALQARASAWFDQAGMVSEAVSHALAAGNERAAIAIVERHAQLAIAEDRWPELANWLEQFSPAVARSRPELMLAHAWVSQSRGHYSDLISATDRARVLIEQEAGAHPPAWRAALLADIDVLLHMMRRVDLDPDGFVATGEAAVTHASHRFASSFGLYHLGFGLIYRNDYPGVLERMTRVIEAERGTDDPFARQRELWARLFVGFIHFNNGELAPALAAEAETLGLATAYGSPRFAAMTRYLQGWAAYERNQLDEAVELFDRVVHERTTGIIVRVNSTLGLARSLDALGRADAAEHLFQRLAGRYEEADQRLYGKFAVHAYAAERLLARGDLEPVARWLRGESDWRALVDVGSNQYPFVTRVRGLIALGWLDEAAAALSELERAAEGPRALHYQIRVQALRALHSFVTGDQPRARQELRSAAQMAPPAGYVRGIFDLGYGSEAFRALLDSMPAGELPLSRAEIDRYYGAPEAPAAPAAIPERHMPYEQLTEREQDVAGGLMRRLSYKEIALELGISPLTVKSHSTHIYSKLGVTSRRQMIRLLEQ